MSKTIISGPNKKGKRTQRRNGKPIRCNRLEWRNTEKGWERIKK